MSRHVNFLTNINPLRLIKSNTFRSTSNAYPYAHLARSHLRSFQTFTTPNFSNAKPGSRLIAARLTHSQASKNGDAAHAKLKICWKCEKELGYTLLHCDECGKIQPVPGEMNYFEALGVGEGENRSIATFDLNARNLRSTFLTIQQKVHPDSYAQKEQHEFSFSKSQSSFINKAYNTLLNPLSRAQYILSLNGISVDESESLEDPELLMEVLETREQLEEAQAEEEVEIIATENQKRMEETINGLSDAFRNKDFKRAKQLAIELQYWVNIERAIKEWAPGKRIELHH
ncbi:uncharacterized protein VTP21DRAFT_4476 [Calcarisporiella thermophila]|uniref:uncharacterized protein n=1 Tax=Calcarisporiella thermophila TaxID=911321 RepID=UPI003743942F